MSHEPFLQLESQVLYRLPKDLVEHEEEIETREISGELVCTPPLSPHADRIFDSITKHDVTDECKAEVIFTWFAVPILADYFANSASPVDDLIDMLSSTDAFNRASAAQVLAPLRNMRAVPALLRALDDPAPEVRARATFAVGAINSSEAYPHIVRSLCDPHLIVRVSAITALILYCAPVDTSDILPMLQDEYDYMRRLAIAGLMVSGASETVEAIRRCLDDESPDVRAAAIDAMRYFGAEEASDDIRKLLLDSDSGVRDRANSAFGITSPTTQPTSEADKSNLLTRSFETRHSSKEPASRSTRILTGCFHLLRDPAIRHWHPFLYRQSIRQVAPLHPVGSLSRGLLENILLSRPEECLWTFLAHHDFKEYYQDCIVGILRRFTTEPDLLAAVAAIGPEMCLLAEGSRPFGLNSIELTDNLEDAFIASLFKRIRAYCRTEVTPHRGGRGRRKTATRSDYIRTFSYDSATLAGIAVDNTTPQDVLIVKELRQHIMREIGRMPERMQLVMLEYLLCGSVDKEQLAGVFAVSTKTVHRDLINALERLGRRLGAWND